MLDSVRAFMQRNKLGRFTEQAEAYDFAAEAQVIPVGSRCEVLMDDLPSRGTVRYVGTGKSYPT